VDIDRRRLSICQHVGRELGVEVVTVRRDLSAQWSPPKADVVVGSPPCHEFTVAKVSSQRREEEGLRLVRRFFELAEAAGPLFAMMEEATTVRTSRVAVEQLARSRNWRYNVFALRDYGAIQAGRQRLFAWKEQQSREAP
jgi:site-specific DNA-cytosine methylase